MADRLLKIVACLALLCALCLAPASAGAETVGIMLTRGAYDSERIHKALESHLKNEGYSGKVKFLLQRPHPDTIALSNAARKLIASDVDIIIAYGASSTAAVLREKPDMPVLYAGIYEPVASNIKSKNKNATGVCSKLNVSSLVRYLRASTTIKNLGVVYHSIEGGSAHQMKEFQEISGKYGFAVNALDLKNKADLTELLNRIEADAIVVTSSDAAYGSLPTVLNVASARKIPTASLISSGDVAALITLVSDPTEQGEGLAKMLMDLIDGKPVQSIEAVCTRKVELVYNVKDAERMGLKISMDLITEATSLINK